MARTIVFDRSGSAEITIYCDNDLHVRHGLGDLAIRLVNAILDVAPDRISFPSYNFTLMPRLDPSQRPVARIEIDGHQLGGTDQRINTKLRRALEDEEFPLPSGDIAIRVNNVAVIFCIYDPSQ